MSFSLIESKVRPQYYQKQTNLEHKYTGISPNLYFRFLLDLDVNKNFIFKFIKQIFFNNENNPKFKKK